MASPRRNLDISSSGPDAVPDGSSSDAAETVRALRDLVMQQQGQISMLQDGLLAAQRDATIAIDRASARRAEAVVQQQSGGSRPPRPGKRSFRQMSRATLRSPAIPVCGFCRRSGHLQRECRRRTGACLVCGAMGHLSYDCPMGRAPQGVRGPAPPPYQRAVVPAFPVQFRPSFPARLPLPSQRQVYRDRRRASRHIQEHAVGPIQMSADPERGPTPDATIEPAVIPDEAVAGTSPPL